MSITPAKSLIEQERISGEIIFNLEEKIKTLQQEISRLKKLVRTGGVDWEKGYVEELQSESQRYRTALERIKDTRAGLVSAEIMAEIASDALLPREGK